MSTEQLIIILAGVSVIVVFVLSHSKVSRTWKIFLFICFLAIVISSTILQVLNLKKKKTKEAAHEIRINQIDTHIRASLSFEDYVEAARMNRQAGRIDAAMYDVSCALERNRKSAIAQNLLGVLYFEKEEFDSAIQVFTEIKEGLVDSDMTMGDAEYIYHRNFGEAYARKGMWKEAEEEFRQCLSLKEDYVTCHLNLATVLETLQEWQDLYNLCKEGVFKFPTSPDIYNFLGKACIATGRLDEGELVIMQLVAIDSTFGLPYILLATIYLLRKEPQKSTELVEKALQLDPSLAKVIEILKEEKLLP